MISIPGTSSASVRFPDGTMMRRAPASRAATTAGRIPATGRTRPSRASSPTCTHVATDSAGTSPVPARIARAIARSNPLPCFGRLAGDKFTVTRVGGITAPELATALRTRSFDSPSDASGNPMSMSAGNPDAISASMSTRWPDNPDSAMDRVRPTVIR